VADAHRHFGNLKSNRRDYELAVTNYTHAASLDPAYTQVWFSRGVILWREFGDHKGAIRDLTRVIKLDPTWADAYFNRAMARKMLGEYEDAIQDIQQYLEQEPEDFWLEAARRQLDELLAEVGRDDGS
jgi:tetratricopeptide (TPR) repeat protein